jgi:hypothetical protein
MKTGIHRAILFERLVEAFEEAAREHEKRKERTFPNPLQRELYLLYSEKKYRAAKQAIYGHLGLHCYRYAE